jgi:hypothetical protein
MLEKTKHHLSLKNHPRENSSQEDNSSSLSEIFAGISVRLLRKETFCFNSPRITETSYKK